MSMIPNNEHLKNMMIETLTPEQVIREFEEYDEKIRKQYAKVVTMLTKERKTTRNAINGALKQTINAHGPVTKELIGSATKRILGSIYIIDRPKKTFLISTYVSVFIIGLLLGIFI